MRSRDDGERERIALRVRELLDRAADAPSRPGHRGPLLWRESDATGPEDADAGASDSGDAGVGDPYGPATDTGGDRPDRWRPARRWRADPGRRGVVAVAVAALVAAALTYLWVRASGAHTSDLAPAPTVGSALSSGASTMVTSVGSPPGSACAAPGSVVVDVAGKVRRPGVYTLPTSARVVDAVRAAGGALPGVSVAALNLAAHLSDGQQISVGVTPAAPVGTAPGSSPPTGGTVAGAPVNLNTAGLEQLEALPGVGPVLAQHILDWRTEHGGFTSVDQLQQVSGIGDAKYATLKPLVTV